jgi:hypothetical protein
MPTGDIVTGVEKAQLPGQDDLTTVNNLISHIFSYNRCNIVVQGRRNSCMPPVSQGRFVEEKESSFDADLAIASSRRCRFFSLHTQENLKI